MAEKERGDPTPTGGEQLSALSERVSNGYRTVLEAHIVVSVVCKSA